MGSVPIDTRPAEVKGWSIAAPLLAPASEQAVVTFEGRIYVIGGEGFISVVQQLDAEHYKLIANVPSIVGGRTGYWYPQHDRLYVAVQAHGNEPAQLLGYEAQD